jgi:hypothetical protein
MFYPSIRVFVIPLVAAEPETLACMHGSAWHGSDARLLRALADQWSQSPAPG